MTEEYRQISNEELKEMIRLHQLWRNREKDGVRADFSVASLIGEDFSGLNLSFANMESCYLANANFSNAILNNVDFSGAILWDADFTNADLCGSDFRYSRTEKANFTNAKLKNIIT